MAKTPHSDKYIFYTNRKKSKFSWQLFIKCLFSLLLIIGFILYSSKLYASDFEQLTSSKLYLGSGNALTEAITLNSKVHFDIDGPVITTEFTQSFYNQTEDVLVGTYAFPLPINAAVNHLKVVIGERIIEGKIMEKQQAIKTFKKALASGKKASLVTQHKANVFTNKIANIAPNETITVTLTYVQLADYNKDTFSLRFPMTFTPQYQPIKALAQPLLQPQNNLTNQHSRSQKNNITITANINAGLPLEGISSNSHVISQYESLNQQQHPTHNIFVKNTNMDKDFVLNWQPIPSNEPQLAAFSQTIEGEFYQLLMLLPPTTEYIKPLSKNITFILDKSGSMQGQSIQQAKSSLLHAISTLSTTDTFNIIAFESSSEKLFERNVNATAENLRVAEHFIQQIQAGGGTEMEKPLKQALTSAVLNEVETTTSQIIFITDGAINNEIALFKIIDKFRTNQRLFTIGIGSAPNSFFMRKAAQFGQGKAININNLANIKDKIDQFMLTISQPVMTNITIEEDSDQTIELYPRQVPDLFAGQPLIITAKTKQPNIVLNIQADNAQSAWYKQLSIEQSPYKDNRTSHISTLWAKAKIGDLLDKKYLGADPELVNNQIIQTSVSHQVLSPLTAFIAVEKKASTTPALTKARIKNMIPAGTATPFPQTATNWQFMLMIGISLLLLLLLRVKRFE